MQTLRLIIVFFGAVLVLPLTATAQSMDELDDMEPQERRAYVESLSAEERRALMDRHHAERASMTREERDALRAKRRAQWESMTDEERAAARQSHQKRVEQRREHWDKMSADDRAAARQRFRDRRDGAGMRGKRHGKRHGDQP